MKLTKRLNLTVSLIFFCGILLAGMDDTWTTPTVVAATADVAEPAGRAGDDEAKATFFREKVLPLLESRCFECHGPESEAKGDLKLSSRAAMLAGGESGAAIVPEKPDESLLIQAVRYEGFEMPPRSRMPDEEIEIFSQWIADGAVWPEGDAPEPAKKAKAAFPLQERMASHWAWKKIERPAVPEVKHADWPASDIDRFLLAKMEEAGIAPVPDADRRVLLRRLYFDLIGLPPTIEQQDRFFNDPAETPVAMEKVVDELLASPQYGERWGRHWLDLVRYAETLGHEFDYPLPYAWRYRDYVIRAINADVPYDKFVREHIAGDLMTEPRRNPELGFNESIIATGFWYLCEDKHAPVDVKGEEATRVDNQIDVFGKTFLGLTIACARCHDHKFDAITADDYYALSGFLQSSRRRVEWIDSNGATNKLLDQLKAERANASTALNAGMGKIRVDVREKLLLRAMGEQAGGDDNLITGDRVARLKEMLLDPKSKDLSNPLALLATVVQKPSEQSDSDAIQDWLKSRVEAYSRRAGDVNPLIETPASQKFERSRKSKGAGKSGDSCPPLAGVADEPRAPQTLTFADLRVGLPNDWHAFGAAFYDFGGTTGGVARVRRDAPYDPHWTWLVGASGDVVVNRGGVVTGAGGFGGGGFNFGGVAPGGESGFVGRPNSSYVSRSWGTAISWTQSGCTPDSEANIRSASLSPKLKGELHSPEFELTHPEVHILAAGKSARVRLVIDGYVMNEFSELLFGGCRQSIDTDGEFRWIKIAGDVKRYLGHRCHLEFLDEGDGWFAVREVKFVSENDNGAATRPEICGTNAGMKITSDLTRRDLTREWARVAATDPAWRTLAVRLKLLPDEQQAAFDNASAAWMKLAEQPQPGDPVLVMCDGTGEDEHIFIRGNHNNPGPIAKRHLLTALDAGKPLSERDILGDTHGGSGRMELADRVLADSNPFPSRVAVNRVWQHLFGRGIVPSSDNFGVLGEAPTHPELLDLLADDFRKDGWSMKRLIKRLVMTRAYRISSQRSELAEQLDPTNKLLHRFSVRRLEGEVIRDELLAISGRLDSAHFGPPVPTYLTSFMEGRGRPGESGPLDGNGRRSIYQSVRRNFLNPFMLAFDTPQPATAISRRSVSNVPAQSLILMNNEFVHQQANVWAKRLLATDVKDDADIIKLAYRTAFAREPSATELTSLLEFVRADSPNTIDSPDALQNESTLTSICHVLLNQKELLFLE